MVEINGIYSKNLTARNKPNFTEVIIQHLGSSRESARLRGPSAMSPAVKLTNEDDDEHAAKLALCLAKAKALLHSAEKEDFANAAMQSTFVLQQALFKNELGEFDNNWVGAVRVLRNRIVHYN